MAKDTAVKSIVAAMAAVNNIQNNKNKLMMNMLQNSERFRNSFLMQLQKNKMALQNKKDMIPIEVDAARQKATIIDPVEQARIDYYKGGGKKPTTEERVKAKVAESGIESLTLGEKSVWGLLEKKGRTQSKYTIDPEVTDRFYENVKKNTKLKGFDAVREDINKNFYKYQAAGVDTPSILKRMIMEPESQQPESGWAKFTNFFKNLTQKKSDVIADEQPLPEENLSPEEDLYQSE